MKLWTAVVLSSAGEYHGTCVALTEEDLIADVREQFDPEGEWEGEFSWDDFADYFAFRIYPNPHELRNPDDDLALWFTPDAIRDHFEVDNPDPAENLSDADLRKVGAAALDSDSLYKTFHEVLVHGLESLKEG